MKKRLDELCGVMQDDGREARGGGWGEVRVAQDKLPARGDL